MKFLFKLIAFFVLLSKVNYAKYIGGGNVTSKFWPKFWCSNTKPNLTNPGHDVNMSDIRWLGVVRHTFMINGKAKPAVTSALLIKHNYAIAGAEDISKIPRHKLKGNTQYMQWISSYYVRLIDVLDYILHPEYPHVTYATMALLKLSYYYTRETFNPYWKRYITRRPVCMPHKKFKFPVRKTTKDKEITLYGAKMLDDNLDFRKQFFKMELLSNEECVDIYENEVHTHREPVHPICVRSVEIHANYTCLWDSGIAVMDGNTDRWIVIGFGPVRGIGCGHPIRVMDIRKYMDWMEEMIVVGWPTFEIPDEEEHLIVVDQLGPTEIIMYPASTVFPKGIGQCEDDDRGHRLYSDKMTILTDNEWGRGYFFVVVSEVASFTCAEVKMVEVAAKSKTRMWVEHNCHKEIVGMAYGQGKPRDYRKTECFMYFKSTAFVEFRFLFSFKAVVELTLWGFVEVERRIPISPFLMKGTTEIWWPTDEKIHWSDFGPYYTWWYNL